SIRSPLFTILPAAAAILTIVSIPPAAAQVKGVSLQLTPYAGMAVWAKETNLADKPVLGGRAGLMFGFIGLEGTFGHVTSHTREGQGRYYSIFGDPNLPSYYNSPIVTDTKLNQFGGDVVLNILPGA